METKYELNIFRKITANDIETTVSHSEFTKLLYIESGNCEIVCNEKKHIVSKGETCIIMPFSDVTVVDASLEFCVSVFSYLLFSTNVILPCSKALATLSHDDELSKILNVYFAKDSKVSPNMHLLKKSLEYYAIYLAEENVSSCKKNLPHKLIPVISYLENNYRQNFTIADVAKSVNISESGIYKLFTSALNQSPKQYIRNLRMSHAVMLLKNTEKSISDIAFEAGFYDQFYFSKEFKKDFGVAPAIYRNQKTFDKK